MTKRRRMFLTGPGIVSEVTGEDVDAARSAAPRSTTATASATSSPTTTSTPRCWRATCSTTCPQHAATPPDAGRRWTRAASGPTRRPGRAPQGLRRPRRRPRAGRRRPPAGGLPRAGRATHHRLRPRRRPRGRHRRQQPALPRWRPRRPVGDEGARFVRTCDLYGLPLVVLVDTPGLPARHRAGGAPASSATAPSSCTRSPRRRCRA